MSRYHYRGPTIDHTLLSPSGRCSKRAREAMLAREAARLFPPGCRYEPPTEAEKRALKVAALRRSAATLRDLAARGMSPRKFERAAAKIEAQADALENEATP